MNCPLCGEPLEGSDVCFNCFYSVEDTKMKINYPEDLFEFMTVIGFVGLDYIQSGMVVDGNCLVMSEFYKSGTLSILLAGDGEVVSYAYDEAAPEYTTMAGNCAFCGREVRITVKTTAYVRYAGGASHIQEIFPELSLEDREFLISRTCGKCWDDMMKEETDEEI